MPKLPFTLSVGNPSSKYSTHHSSCSSLSGDSIACVTDRRFHGRQPVISFSVIQLNVSVCQLPHSFGRRFLYSASDSILSDKTEVAASISFGT
ncbi:hypothetical protein HanRHA438_Chr14g0681481 [Helianthus annuus]|nr:hypothetical protein HanRHA438_Chr14g0681481 [Helianthus annuus]